MKHLPTQTTFTDGLAGPTFTKRFDTKLTKGAPLSKVKTTKQQAFNFAHPSSTINFTSSYDVITPTSRAPINFRLFNLSKSGFSGSAKGFKIPSFVFVFVQKYKEGHKSVKSVNPLSMKMMIKQMSQFYAEKVNQAKDSVNVRNATMLEFVYEYLQNRYGKTPILERKVKEILLTTLKNETKFKNIKLFARFLGISLSTSYTNDDLSMYYCLNRLFYINDVYTAANSVKKEFNFHDSKMNVGRVLDQIKLYFSGKTSQKNMNKLIVEILDKVPNPQNGKPMSLSIAAEKDLYSLIID